MVKIHIFNISSKMLGPTFIKLVMHDTYDKGIDNFTNCGAHWDRSRGQKVGEMCQLQQIIFFPNLKQLTM